MSAIRAIKLWQAAVLVVVLVAASGAFYAVYNMVNDAGGTGLQEGQQSIPVQRGDLVNQVYTNGSLVFPNKEALGFGSQGTVGQVSVEEGDLVAQGQLLASLDGASKAALERVAAQARLNLRDAQDLLDEMANGPDLDELQSARDSVTSAQKDLDVANGDLKLVNWEWESELETAQETLDDAQEEYVKPFQKWLGITPYGEQVTMAPQDLLDSLGIDLAALYDPSLRFSDMSPDDPATSWNEAMVYTWLNIFPGTIVVTCDNDVPFQGACIYDEMTTPWDTLSAELEALDTTQIQADSAIAKAENAVAAAENALDNARDALDDLTAGTDELMLALRQAEMDIAQLALDNALEDLEVGQLLASVDGRSTAALERAAAQASVNLRDAQDLLDEIANGPDLDDLQSAQDRVTSARKDLDVANGDLELVNREWESKLETAQEALDDAQQEYVKPFQKWLGITLDAEQVNVAPQDLLDALGIDLDALYDPSLRFSDMSPDDPATPWSEAMVYTWLNIFPGTIVVTCDNDVSFQGACIYDEMTTPWDTLSAAMEALDTTQIQADGAIAKAENAVAAAEDALDKARDALDDLTTATDELMLALRQADVTEAQLALDAALQDLEDIDLHAPFDGIVSRVNIEDGGQVGPDMLAIEVTDPSVIEMDGSVDEIDVLFIQTGALATVTLDALQGQVLAGEVSTIGSAGTGQQGIVTYPVGIRLQVPPGVDLREGLTATASIVLRQENDVLLVPLQAIHGTFQEPTVMVLNNGSIEERPVLLGNSDDFWVVVSGGLDEGEQIVIESQDASSLSFFGGFGGGGRTTPLIRPPR